MKFITALLSLAPLVLMAGQLNVTLENDLLWNDNDYTHGTCIEYVRNDGVRFGLLQSIYTPQDLRNPEQVPGRHPYAGLLLGFVGFRRVDCLSANLGIYDDCELALGVLGPSSRAEEVQRSVHRLVGATDPKGWDHQLRDEFEVELSYWKGLVYRLYGNGFGLTADWTAEIGGFAGTLQIAGGANTEFRVGCGFGLAEDGRATYAGMVRAPHTFIYALAGAEGRVWARNELLEGNAGYVHNHDTIPVDMEMLTGCVKAGLGIECGAMETRCLCMWWGKEYQTQESASHYMSLTIGWRF